MDVHEILAKKFSHRQYSYDDSQGLILYDDGPEITQKDFDKAAKQLAKEKSKYEYKRQRKKAYRDQGLTFENLLEAIVDKESGNSKPLEKLITKRNAIKKLYPKG